MRNSYTVREWLEHLPEPFGSRVIENLDQDSSVNLDCKLNNLNPLVLFSIMEEITEKLEEGLPEIKL